MTSRHLSERISFLCESRTDTSLTCLLTFVCCLQCNRQLQPEGAEIKIAGVGSTPVAVSTQLPAAVVQLSQKGEFTRPVARECDSQGRLDLTSPLASIPTDNKYSLTLVKKKSFYTAKIFIVAKRILVVGQIPGKPQGGRHGMVFGQISNSSTVGNSPQKPLVPGQNAPNTHFHF